MKTRYKNKTIKVLDILYCLIIITVAITTYFAGVNDGSINITFGEKENLNVFVIAIATGFTAIFMLLVAVLKCFFLTALYFGTRYAILKHYKEKLDKIDFENDAYYRDIIKNYSPAVLDYVDNFNIDNKTVVLALMGLELKKKIKITDKINIIDDSDKDLEENEKYILECIKNNNLKNINLVEFKKLIINDAKNKNLIIEKEKNKKDIRNKIIVKVLQYICIILSINVIIYVANRLNENSILILLILIAVFILFVIAAIFPFMTIMYISNYMRLSAVDPYIRSEEGKGINTKLEGLNDYIKSFSKLSEKDRNALTLWEEYLIYTVMFDLNKNIIDEYEDKM